MRSFIFNMLYWTISGLYAVICAILALFPGRWALMHGLRSYSRLTVHLMRWICGIKVEVEGLENIESHVPRIYMTNHQSYFDIFALLAYLPVDFKFITKQELMRIPLFGFSMRRAGYIGIEREDPRKAVHSINEATEKIKGGASVVIFPEGTRSLDGRVQPFEKGGFNYENRRNNLNSCLAR